MRRLVRGFLCLAAVLSAVSLAPAVADAATVSVGPLGECCFSEWPLHFQAAPGEENEVGLFFSSFGGDSLRGTWIVVDDGAPLTAGDGCNSLDPHTVRCGPPGQTEIFFNAHLDLGDMDDRLDAGGACGSAIDPYDLYCGLDADGGDGDDRLRAPNAGVGILHGGPGADLLVGGSSVDPYCRDCNTSRLEGGPGDDYLDAYGRRYDVVSYEDRVDRVVVSLRSGKGGDPVTGEHDMILGVRGVIGGAGNDSITGDGHANKLYGRWGKDLIRGWGGADYISGDDGSDVVGGGSGRDYIRGGGGNDELWSLDGLKDRVIGDSGTDRAHRDYGLDVVSSVESFF